MLGYEGESWCSARGSPRRLPHRRLVNLLFFLLLARRWQTHGDIIGLADRHLLGGRRRADGNLVRLLSRGFRRCSTLAHSDLGVRLSFDVLRRARPSHGYLVGVLYGLLACARRLAHRRLTALLFVGHVSSSDDYPIQPGSVSMARIARSTLLSRDRDRP